MPLLNIIPTNTSFKFMSLRKIGLFFSVTLILISFIAIFTKGLNFGIDFTGGVLIEIRSKNETINLTKLRDDLNKLNVGEIQLQTIGSEKDIAIRVQKYSPGQDKQLDSIKKIKSALANIEIEQFIDGRNTIFRGIGIKSLEKFKARADLIKSNNAEPYLTEPVALPDPERELFFDIEDDPLHNFCYLHGFVERSNSDNNTEKYVAFFADDLSPEAEEQAFADAWRYIMENQPCTVYIYSKHERTTWRKLQSKYSSVCSEEEIETLFDPDNTIDLLHDVVRKYTEWPTHDHTLKTLAQYLDFKWRDTDPSGAASIEWFQRWSESKDPKIKQRILEYNEDDCVATRVLLDKIKSLTFA